MLVLDHRRLHDYAAAGYGAGLQAYLEPAYRAQFDVLDRTT